MRNVASQRSSPGPLLMLSSVPWPELTLQERKKCMVEEVKKHEENRDVISLKQRKAFLWVNAQLSLDDWCCPNTCLHWNYKQEKNLKGSSVVPTLPSNIYPLGVDSLLYPGQDSTWNPPMGKCIGHYAGQKAAQKCRFFFSFSTLLLLLTKQGRQAGPYPTIGAESLQSPGWRWGKQGDANRYSPSERRWGGVDRGYFHWPTTFWYPGLPRALPDLIFVISWPRGTLPKAAISLLRGCQKRVEYCSSWSNILHSPLEGTDKTISFQWERIWS